jgi:Lon protease-like protein
MFPLGSVLFPAMPLALRVFEERYLKMMGAILDEEEPQFGVVLIERGSEVGGGEQRFDVGTTAQLLEIEAPNGPLQVLARGHRRFRVTAWVHEEPYPLAEVEFLDEFEATGIEPGLLAQTETVVRGTLEYLKELDLSLPWPTDIELETDEVLRAWQLAGIAPLGPLDHQDLLMSESLEVLVRTTAATVEDALETFRLTGQDEAEL